MRSAIREFPMRILRIFENVRFLPTQVVRATNGAAVHLTGSNKAAHRAQREENDAADDQRHPFIERHPFAGNP